MLIAVARWIYIYLYIYIIYNILYIQVQEIERTRSFCLKHPEPPSDPSCLQRSQCVTLTPTIVTRGLGPRSRYYEVRKIKTPHAFEVQGNGKSMSTDEKGCTWMNCGSSHN
jgi:hypothetical protein